MSYKRMKLCEILWRRYRVSTSMKMEIDRKNKAEAGKKTATWAIEASDGTAGAATTHCNIAPLFRNDANSHHLRCVFHSAPSGAGCWVLGAGCWVLGAGCWVQSTSRIQNEKGLSLFHVFVWFGLQALCGAGTSSTSRTCMTSRRPTSMHEANCTTPVFRLRLISNPTSHINEV